MAPRPEITEPRRRVLEAVAKVRETLHRHPLQSEIARMLGQATTAHAAALRTLGYLVEIAEWSTIRSLPLILTAKGRRLLGLPIATYLALPVGSDAERERRYAEDVMSAVMEVPDLAPITAFGHLATARNHTRMMAAAAVMASSADACIVVGDPLLAGREDIVAALTVRVPVYVLEGARLWDAADPFSEENLFTRSTSYPPPIAKD